jgi:Phage tail lysozyme
VATVTPKQIYLALTNAGASTVQAIGIMANMLNESSLNPEAVGDQGTSFGLVQQHGAQYATLVSGQPATDMNAQIKVVAQNGGFAAASGSTAGAAAGNFAANYERCVGCQAGGAQYQSRVANAATVAGWVSSGKWPASAGSAAAATAAAGTASNSSDPTCAWGFSGNLVVTSVNVCIVKKTTLRHAAGAGVMVAGGTVLLVGAVILAASAFQRSGALGKAADVAAVVPGGGAAAEGLTVAHRRATRTGSQVTSERRAARTAATRQAAREQRQADTAARQQQRREDAAARRAAGSRASQDRARRGLAPRQPRPAAGPKPPPEISH